MSGFQTAWCLHCNKIAVSWNEYLRTEGFVASVRCHGKIFTHCLTHEEVSPRIPRDKLEEMFKKDGIEFRERRV